MGRSHNFARISGASTSLCKRPGFFLAPRGFRGGGKVEILVLDFHFSTAHKRNSYLWFFGLHFLGRSFSFFGTPPPLRSAGARRSPFLRQARRRRCVRRSSPSAHASASCGTRSPSKIAKRCKAAFQFCTGIVHFLAICSNARNSSFIAASALGNEPRVLITLRRDMFSDSMALVV